jgi:hypothetical protein
VIAGEPMMHWQVPTWLFAATVGRCACLIVYVPTAVILKAEKSSKSKKKRSNLETGREFHGS